MILQSGPNMGLPFPKLFAKNLVFGRSFPVEPYFSGTAIGWSAGATRYDWALSRRGVV